VNESRKHAAAERSLDELADVVQHAQDHGGNGQAACTIKAYARWLEFCQ